MRIVKIAFNRSMFIGADSGIPTSLFKEMLQHLPSDAAFVGCGNESSMMIDYMFFTSDSFKEVDAGCVIPFITPYFVRDKDPISGTITTSCTKIDFGDVFDLPSYVIQYQWTNPAGQSACNHTWTNFQGLKEQYEYCTICNVRRSDET